MKLPLTIITKYILIIGVALISFTVLFVNMKVHPQGVPYYQVSLNRHVGGPFESSGSTSRYALVESIMKRGKFDIDLPTASFASPDVAGADGKYFSLFTPGISFLALPFYYLGSLHGYEQFMTYLLNVVFSVFNVVMILLILRRYKVPFALQITSAFILLFGTNAFAYSLFLTQHIVAAFLVLASIYITTFKPNIFNNLALGSVFGVGLLVDLPNAFMLFPAVLYHFFKNFELHENTSKIVLSIKIIVIFLALGLLPLAGLFLFYNKQTTGSPMVLPQFMGRIANVEEQVNRPQAREVKEEEIAPGSMSPFQSRYILNGLYILLISNERGWLYYSPILFVGLLGMYFFYKNKELQEYLLVPLSIFIMNTLLYAMFGDPWGGWAFGPRYLIPSAALCVLFIPFVLTRFKRNILVFLFVAALIVYSVFVNTLGAVTTTEVPPKQEAETLVTFIPYTYAYNYQLLEKNESYSMLNMYLLKNIHGKTIWFYESIILSTMAIFPMFYFLGTTIGNPITTIRNTFFITRQKTISFSQIKYIMRKQLKKFKK